MLQIQVTYVRESQVVMKVAFAVIISAVLANNRACATLPGSDFKALDIVEDATSKYIVFL